MRILHIMLSCFYVEGLGYQENILPQYHKLMGHDVHILTSTFPNSNLGDKRFSNLDEYHNDYSIHVKKVHRIKKYFWGKELPINAYEGVYDAIESITPDCIFIHGLITTADLDIAKYLRKHRNVIAYADQHGDYYNSKVDTFKAKLIINLFWNPIIRVLSNYIHKFWGTTQWRCQYLHEVYHLPEKKIDLLIMGGDDRYIQFEKLPKLRSEVRAKLSIADSDFVIITGGKIDSTKNIHLLMKAVAELNDPNIKLIIFGQPNAEMAPIINQLSDHVCIHNIGWINSNEVYNYFLSSDLAVFPGTHSVLWEQACACKVPCLVKHWEGMEHVNNGGNCAFLDDISVEGLKKAIQDLIFTEKYDRMKAVAQSDATDIFLYSKIAEKSLECTKETEC